MKELEELRRYYDRRAQEYEDGYLRDDAGFQAELAKMAEAVERAFAGHRVLEVACGTGYWTEKLAKVAEQVTATDVSPIMLAQAQKKGLDTNKVEFLEADAYDLTTILGEFNAGLANFWFSHVPRARIRKFLEGFHSKLGKGAMVFMADNTYLEGRVGELIHEEGTEDTFKTRTLSDGSEHRVLKNYYDESTLRTVFSPESKNLTIHVGEWFWWVSYNLA